MGSNSSEIWLMDNIVDDGNFEQFRVLMGALLMY